MEAGDRCLPRWHPGRLVRHHYFIFAFNSSHSPMHAQNSSAADSFSLSEQEEEENFDLSLIMSLETDVVPCLSDGRVPDYLLTQLAKVLQQGSQLLQHESDEDYSPTPTSLMQRGDVSVVWGDRADSEAVGSTEPLRAVSRERFSYWCLDLLFLICSDTLKGKICASSTVPPLCFHALFYRSRSFTKKSRRTELAGAYRPMSYNARRIRCGRKASRKPPVPKVSWMEYLPFDLT
jgi:hypothetical protein